MTRPLIDEKQITDIQKLKIAFVQGAKWWEYLQTGFTMWPSDRRTAEKEADRREKNGTLGVLENNLKKGGEKS